MHKPGDRSCVCDSFVVIIYDMTRISNHIVLHYWLPKMRTFFNLFIIFSILTQACVDNNFCSASEEKTMKILSKLDLSNYVTIVVIVPESHANLIREVMGKYGAGESEHYSHGSFSVKGTSRFTPKNGARPFIGKEHKLEMVAEERIETICSYDKLESVIEEIKKAHPYEETIIDIYPIYEIGRKSPNKK